MDDAAFGFVMKERKFVMKMKRKWEEGSCNGLAGWREWNGMVKYGYPSVVIVEIGGWMAVFS